jgi:GTPase SAR1 family protein
VTFYSELFRNIIQRIKNLTSGQLILLGNKSDLITLEQSEIEKQAINQLKSEYNISEFMTTSAKTGKNVEFAFNKLVNNIIQNKIGTGEIDENIELKLTLAGLPRVGKTSLLNQFVYGKFEEETDEMTLGGSVLTKAFEYEVDRPPKVKSKPSKKDRRKSKELADEVPKPSVKFRDMEMEEVEDIPEETEYFEEKPGGGVPSPAPSLASESLMEKEVERIAKVERKATVFYKERMNPMKLNKMAVIISTKELYESLKTISKNATRASTGLTLEVDTEIPMLEVKPIIPGCICSPPIANLDARKEYDYCLFLITPLEDGEIPDARVEIYYKDELVDAIPTPINVVKTTIVKITTALTLAIPIIGSLFDQALEGILKTTLPFYDIIGGIDGLLAILTGLFSVITAIFYYLRKPKDATPVESQSLSEVVTTVAED